MFSKHKHDLGFVVGTKHIIDTGSNSLVCTRLIQRSRTEEDEVKNEIMNACEMKPKVIGSKRAHTPFGWKREKIHMSGWC